MDTSINFAIYAASVIGAVALFMMLPRRQGVALGRMGALLGAATLGGLWLGLAQLWPAEQSELGAWQVPLIYYYVFSALAIAAAVRVITHPKPVYSALWFVMVVLATAGLALLLAAEFIAFAMVIIYGGAILVTYVFVLMLASQATNDGEVESVGDYDLQAREPAAAVMAGFLLMAMLLSVSFTPMQANPDAAARTDADLIANMMSHRGTEKLARMAAASEGLTGEQAEARARELAVMMTGEGEDGTARLSNVERVGLELFRAYPLGLELAGVILLVSLVGAVVIARQRVEVDPDARHR